MINQNSLEQKLNTPVQMGTTGAANAMNNAVDSNVINAFASIYTVVWIYDFALNKVKVLRDRADLEEIAVFLLEQAGAQVTCAVNGYEAVKTYTYSPAGTFDMILMDIRMPLLDGYEATHHIRQSGLADAHSIPIIAMTANAFVEDVRKCLAHGMNDHIAKPLDVDITLSKIAKYYHPQK